MSGTNRDDFTAKTKSIMAMRVSYLCSKPDCRKVTIGANSGTDGTISIGVAAHIKAAAPGGKRYDPSMTSEQRKDISNGVWLCWNDSKLIDSDESFYTVEKLNLWKKQAEESSFLALASGRINSPEMTPLDSEELKYLFSLFLGSCKADVDSFRGTSIWTVHAIPLNLKLVNGEQKQELSPSGLASSTGAFSELGLIASPGTGKTTTLLQIVDAMISERVCAPIFISLNDWSTSPDTIFQSILRRISFKKVKEEHLNLLAENGRIALALDGWNELDDTSKKRLRTEIRFLRRNFPDLRIIISSRTGEPEFPIHGPIIEIGSLDEEQQIAIASAVRPEDGAKIVEHARQTPGLRDLVRIPLYLTTLLSQATGGALPKTKEEILRLFVESAEREPEKNASLKRTMQGHHRDYLEAVAKELTELRVTALSDAKARATVSLVQERLKNENQIAQLVQPLDIIGDLVNAHLLVRSGSGALSFQHQQFQEWFASFYVEKFAGTFVSGNLDAKKIIRENILDVVFWEEAILFACERLSERDMAGAKTIASLVTEALGIDPMLSAEMIFRSSETAWEQMKTEVISFAKAWHSIGKVDRAFRFMVATGRKEFSEQVWPLIANSDSQVYLNALRSTYPFRPTVLGAEIPKRLETLSEEVRANIISEIAMNSRMDGIDLATGLAVADPSGHVKVTVIESLLFRHAHRLVGQVLNKSPDQVWSQLAETWHSDEFLDPNVAARIETEAAKIAEKNPDPIRGLNRFLNASMRDPKNDGQVQALVEKIDFSDKNNQNAQWLVARVSQLYPDAVAAAMISNLELGKAVPHLADELLFRSQIVVDDGAVVDRAVKGTTDMNNAIAAVVGPKTISLIIEELLQVQRKMKQLGKYDEALSDHYRRLVNRISMTKVDAFVHALISRPSAKEPSEIAVLAELVARHGRRDQSGLKKFATKDGDPLAVLLDGWAKILLGSPIATRAEFATIAEAAEWIGSKELVPALLGLLSEDLKRRKQGLEELRKAQQEGRKYETDAQTSWAEQYRRAFGAIGGDQTVEAMRTYLRSEDFGREAAIVLKMIWKNSLPMRDGSEIFKPSPDFSVVPEAYAKRNAGEGLESHPFFLNILDAIKGLIREGSNEQDHRLAIKLATVAFSMPYDNCDETIDDLLRVSLPTGEKLDFLTTLVLSGKTLSSALVLSEVDKFLEEAKTRTWMTEGNSWRLKQWLQLLAFTEKPSEILSVLNRVDNFEKTPWNLREVLFALRYSQSMEAEFVLEEFVKLDARMLQEYDWSLALLRRGTLSAAKILLDQICLTDVSGDGSGLVKTLSGLIRSQEGFRQHVYERYEKIESGAAKSLLEHSIADVADKDGVLLLVRVAASGKRPFGMIAWAIQEFLTNISSTRMKADGEHIGNLRKELFALFAEGTPDESQLAKKSLIHIDDVLDEYGPFEIMFRHPDISTEIPWPQVNVPT